MSAVKQIVVLCFKFLCLVNEKKTLMKVLRVVLVVLAVVSIGFLITGIAAPKDFQGQVTVALPATKAKIWDNLVTIELLPQKRKEIKRVEILGLNTKGNRYWKEYAANSQWMIFELLEQDYQSKMTVNMQESTFGMSGTWSYILTPIDSNNTNFTVIENTHIDNILVRAYVTITGRDKFLKDEIKYMKKDVL